MVAPSATRTPGPKTTLRLDQHVAAELGVVREPDVSGIDQGRALAIACSRGGGAAIRARPARARRGC
jgi:hypothetical protein